jgi:hypothetical protein
MEAGQVSLNPKYPDITVRLSQINGNAYSIIAAVTDALRRDGVGRDQIQAYKTEAMSGDYDNLLMTTMRWVETR